MNDDQPPARPTDPLDDPGSLGVALDYLRDGGFDVAADWFAAQLNRAVRAKAEGATLGYFTFRREPDRQVTIDVPPPTTVPEMDQILSDIHLIADDIDRDPPRDHPSLLGGLADRMRAQVEGRWPFLEAKRGRREKPRTRNRRTP